MNFITIHINTDNDWKLAVVSIRKIYLLDLILILTLFLYLFHVYNIYVYR